MTSCNQQEIILHRTPIDFVKIIQSMTNNFLMIGSSDHFTGLAIAIEVKVQSSDKSFPHAGLINIE